MANADDANTSPEVMLQFYRMLYPFKSIFAWLNHEHVPTKLFTHREFAFTLQGDVYLRYHSFNTAEDLKKQVLALNPTRFEIGPVYSAKVHLLFDHSEYRCLCFSLSHATKKPLVLLSPRRNVNLYSILT